MFNGMNLKRLEYSYVDDATYKSTLNKLIKYLEKQTQDEIIQPVIIGNRIISVKLEINDKSVPIYNECQSIIPRPFTFNELATLVVELSNSGLLGKKIVNDLLLSGFNTTSSSIGYPKTITNPKNNNLEYKYKIIPKSNVLMNISFKDQNENNFKTNYENLNVKEIKRCDEKYGLGLSLNEFIEHPVAINLIPNLNIRSEFFKIIQHKVNIKNSKKSSEPVLAIYLNKNKFSNDCEIPVHLSSYDYNYAIDCSNNFYRGHSRFLYVTPQQTNTQK